MTHNDSKVLNWLTTGGIVVMIAILIGGVLSYTNEPSNEMPGMSYWMVYALLGGLYLVGFLAWEEYQNRRNNWIALSILTLLGITCMSMVRFYAPIAFLLMPVTMGAASFLSRPTTILYTLSVVLGINLLPYVFLRDSLSITPSLLVSNIVTIGGMYAIGVVIQVALVEQLRARAEVERLNAQLRDYAAQSAALSAAQERNHMAHILHDSIGHALTVVSVQLEAAERLIERGEIKKATGAIHNARQVIRDGLAEVRASVNHLRSESHTPDTQLSYVLRSLLSRLSDEERNVMFEASSTVLAALDMLPQQTRTLLMGAVQEGLTNALKHAAPTRITLNIVQLPEYVRLTLTNDGAHPVPGSGTRNGLFSLRNRLEELGGRIHSFASDDAFVLVIEVPHDSP